MIRPEYSRYRSLMKSGEMKQFADQARKTLEKAEKYRERAADESLDEIDRARLLAAALAIELNGREWTRVALDLSR